MEPKIEADILKVRKRFYNEFPFWAKHACKIRTKQGAIEPLVLNSVQRRFVKAIEAQFKAEGKVRVVVLKARQQGLSTVISAWMYWWLSQHPANKGVVVAHKADSTQTLFDMYKRIHENVPEMLKPSTKYSSRREIQFDKLDTGLIVATAGGDSIARGETLQVAHLSEVGFYPPSTARDNLNALMQGIPGDKGTAIFIESTANGMTGPFKELWDGAVDGTNGFIPFFSGWWESPEYRLPVTVPFEYTLEEEDLVARHGLDGEQLLWRRRKIAASGRELFQQEYPSIPEEAFIASGRPVFNPDQLLRLLDNAPEPVQRLAWEDGTWQEHPRGELFVYLPHDAGEEYWIGADVSMGVRGGDYSVAQVLDTQKRQAAVWRGHVHPDYYAEVLAGLGYLYNTARIAPENNSHGLLTAVKLGRDMAYPNVFTDVGEGNLIDRDTINIGFRTTVKTKPLIIDRLRAALREKTIQIYDRTTLREMLSYIVTESGAMEAENDCYDDCVMSLAIANHIHEGRFAPVAVTDDFYCEAI